MLIEVLLLPLELADGSDGDTSAVAAKRVATLRVCGARAMESDDALAKKETTTAMQANIILCRLV